MREWITVFCFICISLSGIHSTSAQFTVADSLFSAGDFQTAALEYERRYFLSTSNDDRVNALLIKAKCLKLLGEIGESLQTLDRIHLHGINDSLRYEILYQKILCSYLTGNFTQTDSYIIQAEPIGGKLSEKLEIQLSALKILSLNEQFKWDLARDELMNVAKHNDFLNSDNQDFFNNLISLYSKDSIPKMKSENILFWVSFIPGGGIIYAGKPLEGAFNFLLNTSALSFGLYQIYYGYYFTGYFGGAILLEKFYFGGRKRAEFLLEKRNTEKAAEFNKRIKSVLIEYLQTVPKNQRVELSTL